MVIKLSIVTNTTIIPKNSPEPLSFHDFVNLTLEEMTHFMTNFDSAKRLLDFFNKEIIENNSFDL